MIRKNIWIDFLKHMNKVKLYFACFTVALSFSSCDCNDCKSLHVTTATIFLINETDVVVESDEALGYVIHPGDTLTHTESNRIDGDRPTADQYFLSFSQNNNRFFYNSNSSKCEMGVLNVKNYENRKEISELEFEFTFRFTEEKRQNSEPCNL
jgi:hypothetical protein